MRIGILTLPLHINYGGILQAYALQTVLERMGHEITVFSRNINYMPYPPLWKLPLTLTKRCIQKFIFHQKVKIFNEYRHNKEYDTISKNIQTFIKQYIHIKKVEKLDNLKETDFDCIVVGSDQIWRKKYFTPQYRTTIDNAYLAFARNWKIIKIAYAASFGSDEWEYNKEETSACKDLIKRFHAISVREDCGVVFCKKYFDVDPMHLLDPTMLLTKEDYLKLIKPELVGDSNRKLFYYILDQDDSKSQIVKDISKKLKLSAFTYTDVKDRTIDYNDISKPPVENWICSFMKASYIVTDSFHGTVFSILFNKPFTVIINKKRGNARIKSILKMFHLEDCLYNRSNCKLDNNIDWEKVNYTLNSKRNDALRFLKDILYKPIP